MKSSAILLGLSVLATCPLAFGQQTDSRALKPVAGGSLTLGEAIAMRRPRLVEGGRLRPKVIQLEAADSSLMIPAAGSVQGSGGTYFHSDFALANHRSTEQTIGIGWMAQGVDNSAAPLDHFTIPANTTVFLADVVADTLGKSGLGTIVVFGETPGLAFDGSAQMLGFSRIWTNQPNATGTVSLQFPAVSLTDSLGSLVAFAAGLRHDSQYRTNVGIVNLDTVAHTWTIRIVGLAQAPASFTVTVPPVSMKQVPLPTGNYGDLFLEFESDGFGFWWSGYGASVDNITGDGWVARAIQP